MKLSLHRAEEFNADFDQQHRWYLEQAGEELAERFVTAVENTLQFLPTQPDLGHRRKFRHPALVGIRSFRIEPPFQKILIFYRYTTSELSAERLMHGARDLPRRLAEPLP
ncbi:MAG: type II toxin-antitoxin system RelE/ParE family toxin [Verrucomicrobiota bacterium]|jgi:toxin ParE1/3/4